jgi:hypothetical protein
MQTDSLLNQIYRMEPAAVNQHVAELMGLKTKIFDNRCCFSVLDVESIIFDPSGSWTVGGPIIDEQQVCLNFYDETCGYTDIPLNSWSASFMEDGIGTYEVFDKDPLMAAMRCIAYRHLCNVRDEVNEIENTPTPTENKNENITETVAAEKTDEYEINPASAWPIQPSEQDRREECIKILNDLMPITYSAHPEDFEEPEEKSELPLGFNVVKEMFALGKDSLQYSIEQELGPLNIVYFSGLDGYNGGLVVEPDDSTPEPVDLDLVTICVLTLNNGFRLVGYHVFYEGQDYDWEYSKLQALNDALVKASDYLLYMRQVAKFEFKRKSAELSKKMKEQADTDEAMDSNEGDQTS